MTKILYLSWGERSNSCLHVIFLNCELHFFWFTYFPVTFVVYWQPQIYRIVKLEHIKKYSLNTNDKILYFYVSKVVVSMLIVLAKLILFIFIDASILFSLSKAFKIFQRIQGPFPWLYYQEWQEFAFHSNITFFPPASLIICHLLLWLKYMCKCQNVCWVLDCYPFIIHFN